MTDPKKTDAASLQESRALLEARLRERSTAAPRPTIQRADRNDVTPLSFAQQRLWFLDQLTPGSPFYNISQAYRLCGPLDEEVLKRALAAVVERHEALRTLFPLIDERPAQRILAKQELELLTLDISGIAQAEREKKTEEWIEAEAQRPFDLAKGPLFRSGLLRLGAQERVLLLTMHHIVSDGWSMGIFLREFASLYEELSGGRPASLPELPIQYADFTRWQREWLSGETLKNQLSYWRNQLSGLPVVELPTDRPRPAEQTFRGMDHHIVFSENLTSALKELSRQERTTLYMTLLAAFAVLLSRYTDQEDIVVGSPIAGRNRWEIEGLIGFFVNTLVLRADLSRDPSFRELLGRVREVALQAYAHQDVPFEKLVEELQPERNLAQNPLFQILFAVQNAPRGSFQLPGLRVSAVPVKIGTTRFDLEVHLWESGGRLSGNFVYAADLFEPLAIEKLSHHFQVLLEGIVADRDRRLSQFALMTEAERREVLEEWNQTAREYPSEKTLHRLFEEQVERTPEAVAVVFGQERVSYRELNERANRLARYLRKLGVGPEQLVGLCVERSSEMVVGLLGILKAGGAYVPLDPSYPRQRLRFMLEDTGARVVLTQERLEESLPEGAFERVKLDGDWGKIEQESGEDLSGAAGPENLAYVIYTSGSTGVPKGVLVNHGNVSRLFDATQPWFEFNEKDVWTLFHSYGFDFSVWEMWGALLYGGRLVIVPYLVSRSPEEFYRLLCTERVTVLNQTPSAFLQLLPVDAMAQEDTELALRLLIFGGEALDIRALRPWFDRHGDQRPRLVNMYGITETTVHVTYRPLTTGDVQATTSVIGRPIPDLQLYILDSSLQPVPLGVRGEIYVGGSGLARGYLNRPELTAERFLPDPFRVRPCARIYRTGDLARRRLDGEIEYLGRKDDQVKIRGFRVELGEIESVLAQHPAVAQSVVLAREDTPGDKRLVAYIVQRGENPSATHLRSFSKELLPDYMVPSEFVFLSRFPLTPNGKVDRQGLPVPDTARPELEKGYEHPRTPVEETLVDIWRKLLRLDQIGVHDDFFELGGHSLLATQLISRTRDAFHVDVSLRNLFMHPTIAGLALAVAQRQAERVNPAEIGRLLDEVEGAREGRE